MKDVNGKAVRQAFQRGVNHRRKHNNISIHDLIVYDDNGNLMSESMKSRMLNNERNMSLWVSIQILNQLGTSMFIHKNEIRFSPHEYIDMVFDHLKVPHNEAGQFQRAIKDVSGIKFTITYKPNGKKRGSRSSP